MRELIWNKVKEIETSLRDIHHKEKYSSLSLLTGISSLPIFYFALYKYTDNKNYLSKINEILDFIFSKINDDNNNIGLNYSSGLAGIGYMLHFINENNEFDELSLDESLNIIDDLLLDFTKDFISNISSHEDIYESIDFLHGIFGIIYYLKARTKINTKIKNDITYIYEKLALLIQIKCIDKIELVKDLNFSLINDNSHKTNCGLAHGLISYLILFCEFSEEFPNNIYIKQIVNNIVSSILEFKNRNLDSSFHYPGIAVNPQTANYQIHLGWCYGDQAVSIGLLKASKILKNENIYKEALNTALLTLKRDTPIKAFLSERYDAGFCHGTTSVAYIHKIWYKETKNVEFKKKYEKFIHESLKIGNNTDGIAGFKRHYENGVYLDSIGLIDGIIGIGIVFIDYLMDNQVEKEIKWRNFFLI